MSNLKKLFGKQLKAIREEFCLTQETLAERINISSRALSSIECGKSFVTAETIEKICIALEISPRTLFDFEYNTLDNQNLQEKLKTLIDKHPKHTLTIYNIIKGYLK